MVEEQPDVRCDPTEEDRRLMREYRISEIPNLSRSKTTTTRCNDSANSINEDRSGRDSSSSNDGQYGSSKIISNNKQNHNHHHQTKQKNKHTNNDSNTANTHHHQHRNHHVHDRNNHQRHRINSRELSPEEFGRILELSSELDYLKLVNHNNNTNVIPQNYNNKQDQTLQLENQDNEYFSTSQDNKDTAILYRDSMHQKLDHNCNLRTNVNYNTQLDIIIDHGSKSHDYIFQNVDYLQKISKRRETIKKITSAQRMSTKKYK